MGDWLRRSDPGHEDTSNADRRQDVGSGVSVLDGITVSGWEIGYAFQFR